MKYPICKRSHPVYSVIWLLGLLWYFPITQAADKQIIGWLEQVHINEARIVLDAKIDTGADNSSIKAKILKKYERDGKQWVRFRLRDKHNHTVVLERKIERYTRIKRKMAPAIRRPVVKLGLCLGNVFREAEVNLAERKKFKYHILIGRSFLKGIFLVDSDMQYETRPVCPDIKGD